MKLKGQKGKERKEVDVFACALLHSRPGPTGNFLPTLTFYKLQYKLQREELQLQFNSKTQ